MNHEPLPYHEIPDPPAAPGAAAVVLRLVDGLGFRYRWATEGLRPGDGDFSPGPDSMSLLELVNHICRLAAWLDRNLDGAVSESSPADLPGLRRRTLEHLVAIRTRLLVMSDDQLSRCSLAHAKGAAPFWNMINGPLADALTHVGQINAWRRLAGNPAPRADVFRGRPPEGC